MRDRGLGATWAAYVSAAREHAGMSRAELARAAQVGRATVYRWEAGEQRPEQAEIVVRFATATGVSLDEALRAAGLRPDTDAPDRPQRQDPPMNPDALYLIRRLADPDVSAEEKDFIRATLRRARRLAEEQDAAEHAERERRQATG